MKKSFRLTLLTGIIFTTLSFGLSITASAACPLTNLFFGGGFGNNSNSLFGGNNAGFGNLFGSLFGGNNMNFPQNNLSCPPAGNIFNIPNIPNIPNNNCTTNTCPPAKNTNDCAGGSCPIVSPPQLEKVPEPEKSTFELEKGSVYSLKLNMSGRNLSVKSSDPDTATASLRSYRNGTAVILVRAHNSGEAVITVCPANNPAACETVYIKVADAPVLSSQSPPETLICDTYAEEVLKYVNEARAKNNLSALQLDATLCAAAEVRAKEVTTRFSHTRPDGTSCFTVLRDFGIKYSVCGENIALGFTDAKKVVDGWLNSSSHRANILNPNFKFMGLGKSGTGWCQLFTG